MSIPPARSGSQSQTRLPRPGKLTALAALPPSFASVPLAKPGDLFQAGAATSGKAPAALLFVDPDTAEAAPKGRGGYRTAPAMSDLTAGRAVVSLGHEGAAVAEIQKLLTQAGFPVAQTAKLGPTTESKIKEFQAANGISVNGKIGKTTLGYLREAASNIAKPSAAGQKLLETGQQVAREMGTAGWCLAGVNKATERAFGVTLWGESAFMVDDVLRGSDKFKEIKNVKVSDLKKMPAGTIVVWDRSPNLANRKLGGGWAHGHIAILDGKGNEYSDHKRKMFAPHYAGGGILGVFVPKA